MNQPVFPAADITIYIFYEIRLKLTVQVRCDTEIGEICRNFTSY